MCLRFPFEAWLPTTWYRQKSIGEIAFLVFAFFLVLVIGNIMSFLAERKNPPIGNFIECEGVRLHYFERGDRAAACVVFIFASCTVTERPVSKDLPLAIRRRRKW